MKVVLILALLIQSPWTYLGKRPEGTIFFKLRNESLINISGNPLVTFKYKRGENEKIVQWEFDCKKGMARPVAEGPSREDLEPIEYGWFTPDKTSMAGIMVKDVCRGE